MDERRQRRQRVEEFLYGHLRKQQLVKHWDGDTIAIRSIVGVIS